MSLKEEEIVIGKVCTPIGLKGEVKMLVLTDFPDRFDSGNTITLVTTAGERKRVLIKHSRPYKDGVALMLDNVNDRDAADLLKGSEAVIDESELGELPEDTCYLFEIIGLNVVTDDGRKLGVITEVMQGNANDVYVTNQNICIPALKSVVIKMDIAGGEMVIHPMPGLLPDN